MKTVLEMDANRVYAAEWKNKFGDGKLLIATENFLEFNVIGVKDGEVRIGTYNLVDVLDEVKIIA